MNLGVDMGVSINSKDRCLVVVARFFSGLEQIIETGVWGHSGSPAYYYFISKIDEDNDIDCRIILLSTKQTSSVKSDPVILEGLVHPITIIPYYKLPLFYNVNRLSKIEIIYNKVIQSIKVFVITKGYSRYYIDRDNFILAALILRLKKSFVIIRLLGVTDSVYFHLKEKNNILSLIIKYVFNNRNSKIICSNDGSYAELVSRDYAKNKFNLLFNGVNKEKILTSEHKNNNITNIVYLSRIEKNKGHEDFLYALKDIKAENEFKVVIIGDGVLLNKLKKLARELKLEKKVEFVGRLPHENVMKLIESSDFMVSINYDGVFGNNVLEASQSKLPVIALDHPGCLHSAKNYLYLLPRNEIRKNISITISKMIDDTKLREMYSMKSRKFSEEYLFSWQDRIQNELNYIKEHCFS